MPLPLPMPAGLSAPPNGRAEQAALLVNHGLAQERRGQSDAAERCYRQALQLDPGLYAAALNLGTLLTEQRRLDEAEQAYQRAIAIDPRAPAAWSSLGALLACLRRDADAQACLQQALARDPQHDAARFNLGYLWLRQGRLREGWLCHEVRDTQLMWAGRLPWPRWSGEPLAGLSLVIVCDAGLGDLLQMVRYAALLRRLGARRLALWGPQALCRLLSQDAGLDEVWPYEAGVTDQPGWDLWAPMMSLPHLCGTDWPTLPASLPYVQPRTDDVARRAAELAALAPAGVPRVGLVWRGNPRHENDAERSLPGLHALAGLGGAVADATVAFVSLQVGAGEAEALQPPAGLPLRTLPTPLRDMADTAAVVAGLDLVITVDTSVAHLAGALGKPVWVMLPHHKTDWRWLDARSDSPWYPGVMRLFRQPQRGDWAAVIRQVGTALQAWRATAARPAPPIAAG